MATAPAPGRPTGPRARVRVPATSANLGPGFDTLGLALGMYDEVELQALDAGPNRVEVHGEGEGEVPLDDRHLVLRAVCATYRRAGVVAPPLRLSCRNVVPQSRGLGSSASAVVAGVVAARGLLAAGGTELDDGVVLDIAAAFDGHADNVAPCLDGGMALTWRSGDTYRSVRLDPHPDVAPVVFVADRRSSTAATRGLLPDRVPHADAAFTAARAALVVHAMTRAPELLLAATEDRLHQPYRRPAYPETAALIDALRAAGVASAVSGAGPTVLALTTGGPLPAGLPTAGFAVRELPVDPAGAVLEVV